MTLTAALLLAIKLCVLSLIFAIGMSSTWRDFTYLWHRPALLLRALFAMYVAVPVAAFIAVMILDLPPGVEVAIVILAVSAGAPLLPRKLMKIGHGSFMLSLVITSSVLAFLAVPLWLQGLRPLYGIETELAPLDVAAVIAKSFVAPLIIGMLVRWRFPDAGERLADLVLKIAGIALLVAVVVLLTLHGALLLDVGWPSLATLAAITLVALIIGHLFGGPESSDRTGLAIACATRHVGIAMLVAASLPGPKTAVLIVAYLLAAAVVSIPYLQRRKRVASSAEIAE